MAKRKKFIHTKACQIFMAAAKGEKHSMENRAIAKLSRMGLIDIAEYTPRGSAKRIELTEMGKTYVKFVEEELRREQK